jgi:hypothetical protein
MENPREKTEEEVRNEFLDYMWAIIDYWEKESRAVTSRDKLEGLMHSVLATLDGSAAVLPAFIVAPLPCEEDKEYDISKGENYYPYNNPDNIKCDIGGSLHELFYSRKPNKWCLNEEQTIQMAKVMCAWNDISKEDMTYEKALEILDKVEYKPSNYSDKKVYAGTIELKEDK